MGRDEQIEEREVLDSIFPDEITDISETEFRISITLDIPDEDDPAPDPPVLLLSVRYPEDYPDKEPHLDLSPPLNFSQEQQHPHFSVAADKDALLAGLRDTVEESLGMAMVFTLVSALKEAAEALVQARREEAARRHEEAVLAAEREENKKFAGTMVGPESFMAWRAGFLAEMEEARLRDEEGRAAEMKKARVKEPVKMTGRQLWEKGLVGKVDEDAEDEGEDGVPTDEIDKLKVQA